MRSRSDHWHASGVDATAHERTTCSWTRYRPGPPGGAREGRRSPRGPTSCGTIGWPRRPYFEEPGFDAPPGDRSFLNRLHYHAFDKEGRRRLLDCTSYPLQGRTCGLRTAGWSEERTGDRWTGGLRIPGAAGCGKRSSSGPPFCTEKNARPGGDPREASRDHDGSEKRAVPEGAVNGSWACPGRGLVNLVEDSIGETSHSRRTPQRDAGRRVK